jgi:hypothetical protein
MLVYVKLMSGDLISLEMKEGDKASVLVEKLNQFDDEKYPSGFVRLLVDENKTLLEDDIIPIFIDTEPLFEKNEISVYDIKDNQINKLGICLEFDLKKSVNVLSYTDYHPKREQKHIQKNELTDDDWEECVKCLKKTTIEKKERKCSLSISINDIHNKEEKENGDENETKKYTISVHPFTLTSNTFYRKTQSEGNDLRQLLSEVFGIFFEYEPLTEAYSPYSFDQSRFVYKSLSFHLKEYVMESILEIVEKMVKNAKERPYMYSIDIYRNMMKDDLYIDHSLYTYVLYSVDPTTILSIHMDVHEEDYDDYGPRHVEKYVAVITKTKVDSLYKYAVLWCSSFSSRRRFEPFGMKETILDDNGYSEENNEKYDNKLLELEADSFHQLEKGICHFLKTSDDYRLKCAYLNYMKVYV